MYLLPHHAYAFFGLFGDSSIELVQEGTFRKGDSLNIGKALKTYKFCTDGTWDSSENKRGEKIVTFLCNYKSIEALKQSIKDQNLTATSVENDALKIMQEKNFRIDFVIKFTISADEESFTIRHMGYVFDNKELPNDKSLEKTMVQNILDDTPLALHLPNSTHPLSQKVAPEVQSSEKVMSPKKPEASPPTNNPQSLLVGNYIYEEAGQSGGAIISPEGKDNIKVDLNTVNVESLHTCSFEGICTPSATDKNNYICKVNQEDDSEHAFFNIKPTKDGFQILENPTFLCGARSFMLGEYSKCTTKTFEPSSFTAKIIDIIIDESGAMVQLSSDGAHSMDSISKEQAELLQSLKGKDVKITYSQKQHWDQEEKMCQRTRIFTSIEEVKNP